METPEEPGQYTWPVGARGPGREQGGCHHTIPGGSAVPGPLPSPEQPDQPQPGPRPEGHARQLTNSSFRQQSNLQPLAGRPQGRAQAFAIQQSDLSVRETSVAEWGRRLWSGLRKASGRTGCPGEALYPEGHWLPQPPTRGGPGCCPPIPPAQTLGPLQAWARSKGTHGQTPDPSVAWGAGPPGSWGNPSPWRTWLPLPRAGLGLRPKLPFTSCWPLCNAWSVRQSVSGARHPGNPQALCSRSPGPELARYSLLTPSPASLFLLPGMRGGNIPKVSGKLQVSWKHRGSRMVSQTLRQAASLHHWRLLWRCFPGLPLTLSKGSFLPTL